MKRMVLFDGVSHRVKAVMDFEVASKLIDKTQLGHLLTGDANRVTWEGRSFIALKTGGVAEIKVMVLIEPGDYMQYLDFDHQLVRPKLSVTDLPV